MKNSLVRIIIIVVAAFTVIAVSVSAGYFIASRQPKEESVQTTETTGETTTIPEPSSETSTEEQTEAHTDEETPTTEKVEIIKNTAKLLIGSWKDSANFSGYEFSEDGTMKVTYFNMAAINLDGIIEGTYKGTYTLSSDKLTVCYTIYSQAVEKTYTVKVDENYLYLTDEKGEEAMYVREGSKGEMENVDKKLLGSWTSNLSGFEFKENGVVTITYINLESMGIKLPISGKVDGVYTVSGDTLEIKYSIYTGLIQKTYTYSIDGNVLTLTDKSSGEKGTYVKGS